MFVCFWCMLCVVNYFCHGIPKQYFLGSLKHRNGIFLRTVEPASVTIGSSVLRVLCCSRYYDIIDLHKLRCCWRYQDAIELYQLLCCWRYQDAIQLYQLLCCWRYQDAIKLLSTSLLMTLSRRSQAVIYTRRGHGNQVLVTVTSHRDRNKWVTFLIVQV